MTTAAWLRGFEAGAHAGYHGKIDDRLMQYWLEQGGYILEPGGTLMRRWEMEEWLRFCQEVRQRATGHNRLGQEW